MNYLTLDNGLNPASPYYMASENRERSVVCDCCKNRVPESCARVSLLLDETLCTEGLGNCWEVAKELHESDKENEEIVFN